MIGQATETSADTDPRSVEGDRADDEAHHPATVSRPWLGYDRLDGQHAYSEDDQQDAQHVERQVAGPVERQRQGQGSEQAYQERGVEELDEDAQDADDEQDERDVGSSRVCRTSWIASR